MTLTSHVRRRVLTVSAAALLALPGSALLGGTAYASNGSTPHETSTTPQEPSNADFSGHGANQHGAYDSTRDGSPSANGNGNGKASGKPCAGCVGKADNKNPKGQAPDGSDHNHGYECDLNHGIGRGNPAHTGCVPTDETTPGTGGTDGTGTDGTGTGGTGAGENTGTEGTGTTTPTVGGTGTSGSTGSTSGPEVEGVTVTRPGPQVTPGSGAHVLATQENRVLASALPFTGSHVDEALIAGVLLLAAGSASVLLGRRREA
jgi:hypothetical protein